MVSPVSTTIHGVSPTAHRDFTALHTSQCVNQSTNSWANGTIGVMDVVQEGKAVDQHQILVAPGDLLGRLWMDETHGLQRWMMGGLCRGGQSRAICEQHQLISRRWEP